MEATIRFLAAMVETPGSSVAVISSDPLEKFPDQVRAGLAGHWRIDDCLDVDQLTDAVAALQQNFDGVDVLTAILENLQVPMAQVRERLDIGGIGVEVAEQFRDKAQMKSVFADAGIPCARNCRADSPEEARNIFSQWQQPVVVKPLAGMGARNTFRINSSEDVERWLAQSPPSGDAPVLMEEFLTGQEFSFESILMNGELAWHSIGRYDPTPLTVLENPWIQWCVVLPREISGDEFSEIKSVGTKAVKALGLTTGLSHMEWFRRPDGSVAISEVGARPPGAQIVSLMSWAHDADMYSGWARLMIHGDFDPPTRKFAVGAAYLRAQGMGRQITSVTGLDQVSARTSQLVVESRIPAVGSSAADTYEGDGYVIVRSDETAEIDAALQEIISTIKVECR
jgi:biotin carboxylase